MRRLFSLLLIFCPLWAMADDIEVTLSEATALYKTTSKRVTSVHDPSIVYDPTSKRYYIFGTHKAGAYTTDFQNWTWAPPTWSPNTNSQAFVTPAVKKVTINGTEVDMPAFNAVDWSARTEEGYSVDGNMWAPDVLWNEKMQKWCMYLSINGNAWHSSIILLTADNITGPYTYQAPIVICGFDNGSHTYKDTDLELAIGTQSSLPSRYNVGSGWGRRWPHTIDPAVFYDETGKLWLVYGSWSGGIWMLELDEETGLRDYNVTYPSTNGNSDGVTSDPYYGKKVAGGYYVSGEGPYIEYINGYYYLFVSYGFLDSVGGYVMRLFRSKSPNGPYVDANGRSAIFNGYAMNYGNNADNRGVKVMGAYNNWGFMTNGELSQGHNSIMVIDGKNFLFYHTRFNDGGEGFQVRVHQMFQTKNGWLVASPFEYNGESLTDTDIATKELFTKEQIAGTYQLLVHKYGIDYKNREVVTPVEITLTEDGKVTGSYSGGWYVDEGTSYLTIKLGSDTYQGVVIEQQMDQKSIKTISFSALSNNGVNVWGYKMHPKYAVAWYLNNHSIPVSNNQEITKNVDLYNMGDDVDNVTVQWTSSEPDILSEYGRYNPIGQAEDKTVALNVRVSSANYYWTQDYNVTAKSEANAQSTADWKSNMLAHYGFDDADLTNTFNAAEKAELLRNSTTTAPQTEENDPLRNGNVVHIKAGANGKESYVSIPNPLYGKSLDNGATISFFVKRTDNNLYDALFGLTDGTARLYMTGNLYVGYNDGVTADETNSVYNNWIDINHPETVTTGKLSVGHWDLVTITFSRQVTSYSGGVTFYVNGFKKISDRFNFSLNGKTGTTKVGFDYNLLVDLLKNSQVLYLGNGSFWGSPDACYDDVIVYDRELKLPEVLGLNMMTNRVFNPASLTNGIQTVTCDERQADDAIYDMSGRKIDTPTRGIYIRNGKKFVVK